MSAVERTNAVLQLHPDDPVAIARRDLEIGDEFVSVERRVVVRDPVARGHKVALVDLAEGASVRKYGQPIGVAIHPIAAGEHVHDHNLVSSSRGGASSTSSSPPSGRPRPEPSAAGTPAENRDQASAARIFEGLLRPDGRVGTRNYLAVVSSVNCSATVVRRIVAAFSVPGALDQYPHVDGVFAITHRGGCGLDSAGEGLAVLRRTLAGYARHPNVAGLVVVGLGCEVNQVSTLVDEFRLPAGTPVRAMTIQHLGGTAAAIREGIDRVRELLPLASGWPTTWTSTAGRCSTAKRA